MKRFLFLAGLALGSLTAVSTSAATLGLTVDAPSVSASVADINYIDFDPDGEVFSDPADIDGLDGVVLDGLGAIELAFGYNLLDPSDSSDFAFGGFLDISDDAGQVLAGELFAIGFIEDVIELQFNNLTGSGAGLFGSSVLATILFDDPLGPNPFASLLDGEIYGASLTVQKVVAMAPVPLPAGLPLLLAGIGGLALLRRRSQQPG